MQFSILIKVLDHKYCEEIVEGNVCVQPACSKLTIEALEQCVKYVQS